MKPFVEPLAEEEAILRALDPAQAPQIEDLGGAELGAPVRPPVWTPPRSRLGRLGFWVFTTLAGFVISVVAWDFVSQLLARNSALGTLGLGLFGAAALVLLALAVREVLAFARFQRLDGLRAGVMAASQTQSLRAAQAAVAPLEALYRLRPELAWGLARFDERKGDVLDADAYLALAEVEMFDPLDQAARAAIEAAARRVAVVTAVVPLAFADVAVAGYSNMVMIRQIGVIYGGRSGLFGSMALLRKIFTSLIAAGVVSLADDLLGTVAGGGALSKVSRRLGEGVVNAGLTTRVGLAAMELCRPMPFVARARPSVTAVLGAAVGGLLPGRVSGGA